MEITINGKTVDLETQPTWVKLLVWLGFVLSCLAGLFAFTFLALCIAASFTPKPTADGSVLVDDAAGILSADAKAAITQVKFPVDIPVIIRTVSWIPRGQLGNFATKLMYEDPHWQILRPRGWLRKYVRQEWPSETGVYVLISLDPQLLQIRFGQQIRLSAYQQMIAVGPWYRAQQLFKRADIDQHVIKTVKDLAERMHKLATPPWPLTWAEHLSSLVASELEDLLTPSDAGLMLRYYITVAHGFGATRSAWHFILFDLAAFVLFWIIGKNLLIRRLLLPRIKTVWLHGGLLAVANLALLGVLVTGFASLVALSKGRIEDQMAFEDLGLSFLSGLSFDVDLFSRRGGLWLAIPGALVSFLREAGQSLAAVDNNEIKVPWRWLAWGCALFLLPKAIAIIALAVLIWNTGSQIAHSTLEDTTGQRAKN